VPPKRRRSARSWRGRWAEPAPEPRSPYNVTTTAKENLGGTYLVIDARLPSLDRLPQHRELLERAFARFRDDVRAVGLVLGGSFARGGADFYSDVDLYVVVRDGAFEDVLAERDSTAEVVGSPLFGFAVDPVPGGSTDHIVLYEGLVKFDFMYLRESDLGPHPRWGGCVVLKDTDGRVEAAVARSEALGPPRPKAEDLSELNQKFWTLCWYAFGKIERGELWEALDGLHSIRSLALVPLLDWADERSHEGYRRLERKTNQEQASRLSATVAPMRAGALHAALRAEVELFRELRAAILDRYGLSIYLGHEEVLESEMSRRWAARGAG
jgi:predicted nucleotidyltransferase